MGNETRRKTEIIGVRVTIHERDTIKNLASECSMPMSSYLRATGLAHEPRSKIDKQAVHQIAKVGADLGRIGGLLKLWLATPEIKPLGVTLDVPKMLDEMREAKRVIIRTIKKL